MTYWNWYMAIAIVMAICNTAHSIRIWRHMRADPRRGMGETFEACVTVWMMAGIYFLWPVCLYIGAECWCRWWRKRNG